MDHVVPCEEIKEMRNKVARAIGNIKEVRGDLYGNGKEGIMKRVDTIERYVDKQIGGITMFRFLIGFSIAVGTAMIGIFARLFKVI